jgi:hypothetical protein
MRPTSHFPDRSCVPYLRHSDHRPDYSETARQQACDANRKSSSEQGRIKHRNMVQSEDKSTSGCRFDGHAEQEARTWKGYPNLPNYILPTDPLSAEIGNVPP